MDARGHLSPAVDSLGTPEPTLSICVPTFKRPVLVQEAIRSIVQSVPSTARDVELIVSDNSPDVSEQACRRALEEWGGRSVYVGNETDIGITGNLIQCIARASGRYVIFVCDDDRLLPGAVPKILDALAAGHETDKVLLFGVHAVDEAGRILRRHEFGRDVHLRPDDAVRRLLTDSGFAWFPGVVVSADAYAAVGPFDHDVENAADIEMWVRLFARHGVRCVPETISTYSVHADSASQMMAFDADAVAKVMTVFDRARQTGVLGDEAIRRCQAQYLHQFILGATYLHLRSGDVAGARKVMALFGLHSVRSLGPSLTWLPMRLAFALLVRCPPAPVHLLMRWVERHELVRRVRTAQSRGRGRRRPS